MNKSGLTVFTFITLLFLTWIPAYAQLGKKFKDKIKKVNTALDNPTEFARSESVRSLKNSKAEFDSTAFGYAISFSDNAGLFENKETGERIKTGVLFLLEKSDEKDPIDVAVNYMDAGEIAYASNKYRSAEVSFYASKLIFETNYLTNNINYPRVVSDLGLLNHTMARFTLANTFTEGALEMRREMLGEESVAYGVSMNNLAVLLKDQGRYNESEKLLNESILIISSKVEPNDPSLAILFNNKAMLLQSLGRYDEALEFMQSSIDVSAESIGQKSTNHQRLLTNLGVLYQLRGEYDKAEETFLTVIDLKEKRLGKGHPDYAHMLTNLASLYVEMGKDEEVEELLEDAGEIYVKKFGTNHPSYAKNQSYLGNFYRYKGEFDKAEPLLREALVIRSKVLGENHPDYAQSMEDYALVQWGLGNPQEAFNYYEKSMEKTMDFIATFFPPMSEAEKTRYWDKLSPRFQRFYAFATSYGSEKVLLETFNYRVATKALILNSSHKLREEILSGNDEALKKNYLEWIDLKEMLAGYYSYSIEEIGEQNINIDSLENAANEKERYLSSNSEIFKQGYLNTAYTFEDIQQAIEEDEAVIDIVQVKVYDRKFTGETEYFALLLNKTQPHPVLVKIGNSQELDEKYFKYYRNAIRLKTKDEYSYSKFWEPINKYLDGFETAYVSNDGIYHQVSLATLLNNGSYVVDEIHPILVTNTADVVDIKSYSNSDTFKSATLVGYPEYGTESIAPLPGTEKEITSISGILSKQGFSAQIIGGPEATELNVKNIDNPDILHIATHGFFLEDQSIQSSETVFGIDPQIATENPLLRSGLMFNGAGYTFEGLDHMNLSFNDNGILTSYEGLNMKLDKTKLIVLSACETGLGDIKAGEGVYGLQRSFLVAGVNTLIMSLWKVDDNSTQMLMTEFYRNFASSKSIEDSFLKAQKTLKQEFPDPYYWGAFVMIQK